MAFRTILWGLLVLLTASVSQAQDVVPPGEPVAAVLFDPAIGLIVPPVRGAPGGRSSRLAELVTQEAATRGVHISIATPEDETSFELAGVAAAGTGTEVSTVLVLWSLYRADGSPVDSFNAELTLDEVLENPWDAVDDALLLDIAKITADRLVKMEDQFALVPRPRAKPVEVAALPTQTDTADSAASVENEEVLDTIAARSDQSTPILIGKVTGAPGDGDAVLPDHVRAILGERDIPIADRDDKKWYRISANVSLTKAGVNKETVVIIWRVTDPLGEELGQVRQQNDLPPGALEPTWGDDAKYVAQGAVDGILSLLSQAGEDY